MTTLVHQLISNSAKKTPNSIALQQKDQQLTYQELNSHISSVANVYKSLNVKAGDRIGIYLAKNFYNVEAMFACSQANAVFVPINPVLKAPQVQHIINDCQISVLVTNIARFTALQEILIALKSIKHIIITDLNDNNIKKVDSIDGVKIHCWRNLAQQNTTDTHELTTQGLSSNNSTILAPSEQLAAILYSSGSTGKPKGIMLSHKNLILGAQSVSKYLENTEEDRLLAVLPLSFDYGLNQLTTMFLVGGRCVLLDYLFANDVLKAVAKYKITGLAGVPPLWAQLIKTKWHEYSTQSLRYFTNSGGVLPVVVIKQLRSYLPQAKPYLMYGLTEAFRSTYLSPDEIDNKTGSMGKAIPNAEVLVLRPDGSECEVNEVGELVHIGPLVSLGYWQNIEATKQRFKATPSLAINCEKSPLAVYSGDFVKRDADGFLYFIARQDEMIKTSGYRVSPSEVEEVILQQANINEVVVLGIQDKELGQAIIAVLSLLDNSPLDENKVIERTLQQHCSLSLANYMVPKKFIILDSLPKNANGKLDRNLLKQQYDNTSQ
ncbi:acyl-CoA ligase (AMP-forming), exosortase A system-associated [Colwellia sp. D2M02]|uniref:acyl-CoA ligase (AMP-forming), exosortase A system-associated n=1 Tax=Colwellia sp. D2M02 TaxID=2841562 RepID=UPI001C09CC93|nr:acyl-CoA ligase (AMP-forming), exosortase A system-associated [Colwellia sp. D2M02]MBU2893564.1 acyl-CoA ligase (AMP-forming), exosortase A system-associated [Colwellia sp. D2M02]